MATKEEKAAGESNCIKAGLEAFRYLAKLDQQKRELNKNYWFPSELL